MKSITLHNLPADLARELERYADEQHTSLNRAAQALLRKSLHLDETLQNRLSDFRPFLGRWKAEERAEFEAAIASDLGTIFAGEWD